MTSASYSARLGPIHPEQFQKALDGLTWEISSGPNPFRTGLFGQNVFVTSTRGKYVLRGAPYSAWQFPTECFFTDLLHRPGSAGFRELQLLYMLDLALSFWRYFQELAGGLPEDKTKTWNFEQ